MRYFSILLPLLVVSCGVEAPGVMPSAVESVVEAKAEEKAEEPAERSSPDRPDASAPVAFPSLEPGEALAPVEVEVKPEPVRKKRGKPCRPDIAIQQRVLRDRAAALLESADEL
jgi:hypothetical protein